MRAVRVRMRKMGLFVSAKVENLSGARPDEPATPKNPLEVGATPKAGGKRRRPRRGIIKISGGDLLGLYDIGEHVTEPRHPGMEVRFGRRRCNGEHVVIKTRQKSSSFGGAREEREWRENAVAQLNAPRSRGMCEYLAVYEIPDKYVVVMERVRGLDLFDHVQQGHVGLEEARQILFQMLQALKAMHASGRIHRDLNLFNVMADLSSQESSAKACGVSSSGSRTSVAAKLINFDTAESWDPSSSKSKDVMGTPGYIAPEAYSGDYSPASDVYSVGVVMYRLLTGTSPSRPEVFAHPPGENLVCSPAMKRIHDRLGSLEVDFERAPLNKLPDAQDLVKKLMAFGASGRPSAAEALDHPWFRHDAPAWRVPAARPRPPGRRGPRPTSVGSRSTSVGSSSPPPPGGSPRCAADDDLDEDDDDDDDDGSESELLRLRRWLLRLGADSDDDDDSGDDGFESEHLWAPAPRASQGLLEVQGFVRQTAHPAVPQLRLAGRAPVGDSPLGPRSIWGLPAQLEHDPDADPDGSDAGTCDSEPTPTTASTQTARRAPAGSKTAGTRG